MDVLWCAVLVACAWLYRILQRVEARNREALQRVEARNHEALQRVEARNREELQRVEARNREELAVLRSRSNRLLSLDALASARRSVFMLSLTDSDDPVGAGVFFERGRAVTAAHNLPALRVECVFGSFGTDSASEAPRRFGLRVVSRDDELDVAVLVCECAYVHPHFLTPFHGKPSMLTGETMVLCAFQLALREDLPDFDACMGVMPACGIKVSAAQRHVAYSCTTWAGDSGGALLLHDGELVGIHLALVNALHDTLERKLAVDEQLDSVEASLNELVRGVSNGCVALLASHFPRHEATDAVQ
jgi:hypothetical protein